MNPEEALSRFNSIQQEELKPYLEEKREQLVRYGFRVRDIGLIIPPGILTEVVRNPRIYPLPNTRGWMMGMINLRGNLVPVFNLAMMMNMSDEQGDLDTLLVLGSGSDALAVTIDGLPQACDTESWHLVDDLKIGVDDMEDHISGAYSNDDRIWFEFNVRSYFEYSRSNVGL